MKKGEIVAKLWVENLEPEITVDNDGVEHPSRWCVCATAHPDYPGEEVVLWGFGRRKDAEIAMQFLSKLPVDYSAATILNQFAELGYPDHQSLYRAISELLQW